MPFLGLTVIASAPAWLGSWIYDDWRMRGNPLMDGFDDLLAVFARTSSEYLQQAADQAMTGATYRPLAMASLIAVQAVTQDGAIAHHLVSLALHLFCTLGLWRMLKHRAPSAAPILTALFCLHPFAIEAYGWINGRADVLAGACVAWLAVACGSSARFAPLTVFALSAAAVLSKETALFAVAGVAGAAMLPARAERILRWQPIVPVAAGLATAVLIRAWGVGLATSGAHTLLFAYESDPLRQLFRLAGISLEALALPAPRTMRSLAWELSSPMSAVGMVLVCAFALGLLTCAVRGRLRASWLLLCAVLCVVPVLGVSHGFWHGLDRYLYMPAILGMLAVAEAGLRHLELPARLAGLVHWGLPIALGLSTFVTAGTYADQPSHISAMLDGRPEDPTGYLIGAEWLLVGKDPAAARALLARLPGDLPAAHGSRLVTLRSELGEPERALQELAALGRRFPNDPFVLYDRFAVALGRGDYATARHTGSSLAARGLFCRGMRALLAERKRKVSSDATALDSLLPSASCSE